MELTIGSLSFYVGPSGLTRLSDPTKSGPSASKAERITISRSSVGSSSQVNLPVSLTATEYMQEKDEEDAKKKEVEADAILTRPTQSRDNVASLETDSKPRTVLPEEGEDDVASSMHDSAYYAIPNYVVADTIKINFLFLFLPRKEKIRDAIGVQYWWSVLSLKESGWGPPSSVLKMVAHQQRSPFYFSSVYFSFWFRKQLSELLSLFYFYIFILLVSHVIGRSAATIKPKGCAPM
jgi:hypothetical protein